MMALILTSNSWREDLHLEIDCLRVFYSANEGAVYGAIEGNLLV